ncbi:MAG: hypothetical protein RQ753_10540 [Desulfurivibrionaceae bacterium]|nr:hypothetical protein [Desulfurivibrionaceae bacterium]
METRRDDSDGSDIFWPGYVDATTNLILNLLFLLTILIVAVFMFALELGRTNPNQADADNPPITAPQKDAKFVSQATAVTVEENIALKREIERLKLLLAQGDLPGARAGEPGEPASARAISETARPRPGGPVQSVEATAGLPKPRSGLDKMLATDMEIMVRFKDDAVGLTPVEREGLLESLQPLVESGKASIYVEVPAGFSEAKRMGFYRAMTVRNLLIKMEMPKENIEVSVVEGEKGANASLVRVRPR